MVKATEQNDKLNRAVIVSVVLHLILIAPLILGSLQKNIMSACGGGGDGSVVGAVMVDPNAVAEQYNRQQQSNDAQRAEKLHQKKAQQQAEELQQKQAAEQQRLKALEKERLAMQEKTAQHANMLAEQQKAAAEAKEQQKVAEVAAAKAKAEADKLALAQAQAEAQKKAEARKRAEEAKNAAEQKAIAQAKKKAAAAKQSVEVDDLFDGLSDGKNGPEEGGKQKGDGKPVGQGNAKTAGASDADINGYDIDGYMGQIQGVIQSKFYDPGSFSGKTCDLRIKLAPDGLLISMHEVGGDPALCQAAVSAAKLAKMPKPPNNAVYQHFKNFTLGFKPQ